MAEVRYVVLYARANTRKHKKWEGDGFLNLYQNGEMELTEENGREIAKSSVTVKKRAELCDGLILKVGGYEVEIQEETEPVSAAPPPLSHPPLPSPSPHRLPLLSNNASSLPQSNSSSPRLPTAQPSLAPVPKRPALPVSFPPPGDTENILPPGPKRRLVPTSSLSSLTASSTAALGGMKKPFCSPLVAERQAAEPPFIVNEEEEEGGAAPVSLDGSIARHLRPHQKEGVAFLFQRLQHRGGGAILADDMGLGKSIQTIATAWAMIKRKASLEDTVSRCLLVVPSSLLNNWRSEFAKWFRGTRSPALLVRKISDIRCFAAASKITPFLVISYDMALRCAPVLAPLQFDLLVCDEGHRLKNLNGKLRQALVSLSIPRRLLLTGTPIQNDLDELYSLLDFVCPGAFGTLSEFRSKCKEGEGEEGNAVDLDDWEEIGIQSAIASIMLRRSSDVNKAHLPDKHEYVLFCAPSPLQRRILQAIADHVTGDPLVLIDCMRKASNHPAILYKHFAKGADDQQKVRVSYASINAVFPQDYGSRPASISDSGKLSALTEMLSSFRTLKECAVVVSQYTKSLDMISVLCTSMGFRVLRLDGQTPVANRQGLVDTFNADRNPANVFLLSSKAGGVGLNLIGGSRLVLFDMDWNPASDLQAMARIWREGQPRVCHIYRLATTGTIDEKILQRQIAKTGLATVIDVEAMAQTEKLAFRDEDLADIFTLKETECNTHDLLDCGCGGTGLLPLEREREEEDERTAEGLDEDDILDSMQPLTVEELEREAEKKEEEEKEDEDGEEEQGELPSGPASMAELFRWRHYSPKEEATWKHLRMQAGLGSSALTDVTFALHYSASF